uniref:Uncharacterized protein n=1 Tax=Streptomyces sp. NBC_00008 TaxID=2903610 RepID=A0AAU2VSP0_9ACTN
MFPASGLHWKDAAWLAFGVSINAPALNELLPDGAFIRTSSTDAARCFRGSVCGVAGSRIRSERFLPIGSLRGREGAEAGPTPFSGVDPSLHVSVVALTFIVTPAGAGYLWRNRRL